MNKTVEQMSYEHSIKGELQDDLGSALEIIKQQIIKKHPKIFKKYTLGNITIRITGPILFPSEPTTKQEVRVVNGIIIDRQLEDKELAEIGKLFKKIKNESTKKRFLHLFNILYKSKNKPTAGADIFKYRTFSYGDFTRINTFLRNHSLHYVIRRELHARAGDVFKRKYRFYAIKTSDEGAKKPVTKK